MVARAWLMAGFCLTIAAMSVAPVGVHGKPIRLERTEPAASQALAAGEAAWFERPSAIGDYLRGTARATVGHFDLDLVAADGAHIRRLATDTAGPTEFHLVAESEGLRFKATARQPGTVVDLVIGRQVPRSGQVASSTYLSPRIAALATHVAAGGDTGEFWTEVTRQGTPLVEPAGAGRAIVTFLARGAERNVRLFGAPSGDHEELARLGTSDTWFRSFDVPTSTRLAYQLAVDVPDLPGSARERRVAILATAKADPFNHHPIPTNAPDAFSQESLLELADAPRQPGQGDEVPAAGQLSRLRVGSNRLGNEREVTLYRPASLAAGRADTRLLFVFDGEAYLSRVDTPAILHRLIARGELPPVIAVFIPALDRETRTRELPGNDAFADFMALELLPLVQREIGFAIPAERTILAGSSYGGLAAATVALRHPEAFGNTICLSGSFWWHPDPGSDGRAEYLAAEIASSPRRDVRFFLTAGLFETGRTGSAGILETSRHLRDVLTAKDYEVGYREYAGGHDYLVWRGALADALLALTR